MNKLAAALSGLAVLPMTALGACAATGHAGEAALSAQQPARAGQERAGQETAQRQASNEQRSASGRHGQSTPHVDHQARQRVEREDILTQMAFWAAEYETFPDDLEAAQKFSEALRRGGRFDRAAAVANEAAGRFPADKPLLLTLGLSQLAAGHPQEALRPLALVAASDAQDWRSRNALGAAFDQLGRFDDARRAYQEALAIKPDDPGVLTNLGVSHLMAGEPEDAETILRQAAALPGAPAEARQNLAIAVALQGRYEEAERLERIDLPPNLVAENMEYLRGLTSDSRRWGDLRGAVRNN